MPVAESSHRYIPQLRTALVLTGTGTAGAYHAGVIRALSEAGVKIDLVAGRGIGAVGALFAAVDGGARLWDDSGRWRGAGVRKLYRWRRSLRIATWLLAAILAALALPLLALAGAAIVYPASYLLGLLGVDAGTAVAGTYGRLLAAQFDPSGLSGYISRLVVAAVAALLAFLLIDAFQTKTRSHRRRRARGGLWWRLVGTPLDRQTSADWFIRGLWDLMRGAASVAPPGRDDLGKRYAELLVDNLGHPGFREVLLLVHDVDARRDVAVGLLGEPYRAAFFQGSPEDRDRSLEAIDASGDAGRHLMDALVGALSVPVVTDPHLVTFAAESAWRGETHRLCDRFEGTARLLDDVARAGAQQVIVVSAVPSAAGPHALDADRRDMRGRAGQYLVGLETAALQDAIGSRRDRFSAVFEVRPTHNPIGPFDFDGCYDERSDRRVSLTELLSRGYEDGGVQFVDAVVGASGELIETSPDERPGAPELSLSERLAGHGGTPLIDPTPPGSPGPSGFRSED